MRASSIVVAAVCLSAFGVSGCGQSHTACGVADYVSVPTGGYRTPQQALQSVLTQHHQWLATTGWKMTERDSHGAGFTSGDDSVDVVRNKSGKWNVGGVTACQ